MPASATTENSPRGAPTRLGAPLAIDTLFPVASVTKLATALAVLRLVAEDRLSLDEPLARYLPDAAARLKAG